MKVLVIGAGGRTGRLIVDRARAAGHLVTGLLRRAPDAKHPLPSGVSVVEGDAQNPLTLRDAMEGCEAVIDAIASSKPYLDTDLETSTAKAILEVMPAVGAKRLLVISAMGMGESKLQAGFLYAKVLMPTFLRGIVKDKTGMEAEVMGSGVAWTIVRPPILSNGAATGLVHVVPQGQMAHAVTRADVAQFLVDALGSERYLGQAVTIANR